MQKLCTVLCCSRCRIHRYVATPWKWCSTPWNIGVGFFTTYFCSSYKSIMFIWKGKVLLKMILTRWGGQRSQWMFWLWIFQFLSRTVKASTEKLFLSRIFKVFSPHDRKRWSQACYFAVFSLVGRFEPWLLSCQTSGRWRVDGRWPGTSPARRRLKRNFRLVTLP